MERILGLDLGTTTLGMAINDSIGIAVHPYENFRFEPNNYKKARDKVHEVLLKENIKTIVLGYPLNMDDRKGERASSTERFKADLEKENEGVNIILVDERLSTVEAHQRLYDMGVPSKKHKEMIDAMSAVIILETYLNKKEK